MSGKTEKRLEEIAKWYYFNRSTIPPQNLQARIDFQDKVISCLFELIVHVVEDIDPLEHKAGTRSKTLWIPNGMRMNGDVRKLG